MFSIRVLRNVIRSPRFRRDLAELTEYGARIKQERPIVLFCAKYLWRIGHDVIVEGGQDLRVDGVRFEFKYHFDWDIAKAAGEQARLPRGKNKSWRVVPAIQKDINERRPDVFIWIISQRALDRLPQGYCQGHVCFWRDQHRYAQKYGWTAKQMVQKANSILDNIAEERTSRRHYVRVATKARFASTYHFLIRDFR